MNQLWGLDADPTAQGRIQGAKPVAVLDIGSNSVRLVVYERLARSLTPLYNEKSSCALGRGLAQTGRLAYENIDRALTAIQRFALVTRLMKAGEVHILATSAVREASNSQAFVDAVEATMNARVQVLSGEAEAHFAALGVVAGIPDFTGVVGDLGGGSLELSAITEGHDAIGETHGLGVIRMQDDAGKSVNKAREIARQRLETSLLDARSRGASSAPLAGRGGRWQKSTRCCAIIPSTWSSTTPPRPATSSRCATTSSTRRRPASPMPGAENASSSRRDLVPFGAVVLSEVLRAVKFETVLFSAMGVREGYLYSLLPPEEQAVDPLLQGAEEISILRSRSPAHAGDLIDFTGECLAALHINETPAEERLRKVACYLSDIGWRGHPDYRGEQSVDMVAYGSLAGVDHPGRAFLAEALAVRYMGLKHKIDEPAA